MTARSMKSVFVAAAVLLPAIAAAERGLTSFTGRVEVSVPRCYPGPCKPIVALADGDRWMRVRGDLVADLQAFDRKVVTVKGVAKGRSTPAPSIEAVGFAPGRSDEFITGVVELRNDPACPPNARCRPIVGIRMGTVIYDVKDLDLAGRLHALSGATVTLKGPTTFYRCPCNPGFLGGVESPIAVRGQYHPFRHGMNGQTGRLTVAPGRHLLVSGKKWADRSGKVVWMSGILGQERISGATMLRATTASRPVQGALPMIVAEPLAGGSNVGRGPASGAVTATSGTGSSAGAGQAR